MHGAVLKPLYFKYSTYGHNNIYMVSSVIGETLDKAINNILKYQLNMINKVLKIYGSKTADELENINHSEIPWINARGCLGENEFCNKVIDKDIMKRYYKSRALERGMKDVKDNTFKFSSTNLKKAQENLRKKEVFKVNDANYKEYEKFILNSYEATIDITERAEYVRTI